MSDPGWTGLERPAAACAACKGRLYGDKAAPSAAYAAISIVEGKVRRDDFCESCFGALPARPETYWRHAPRGVKDPVRKAGKRRKVELLYQMFQGMRADEMRAKVEAAAPALVAAATPSPESSPETAAPGGPLTAVPPAPASVVAPGSAEAPPLEALSTSPAPSVAGAAAKLRYLLALALVRQRKLELVEMARAGGADCLVLRASGQAELLSVPAPAIEKEELERLMGELRHELEREP